MTELKIQQVGLTDIGNVRKANEDSLGALESSYGFIFTVCDGMGGHAGGATASSMAVRVILEQISKSTIDNASIAINNALISANQAIFNTAGANPDLRGMGTTSTVLVAQPEGLYIGYIGDSRIYIFSDNELFRLTRDDSFVQGLVDRGTITEEEADSHPRKNELIKALGVSDIVQPTIIDKPIRPKKGDILLLCTDGLCGQVSDGKMQSILGANPRDIKTVAGQLINAAKDAGGPDNITVQLIRIVESPYDHSEFQIYANGAFQSNNVIDNGFGNKTNDDDGIQPSPIKLKPILVTGVLIVLLLAFTRVTHIWPFSNHQIPKDTTEVIDKPGENGLFPRDVLEDDWLIHTLSKNEKSLEKIIQIRKQIQQEPYADFNFDTTYSIEGKIVDNETFKREKKIKWKKITTAKSNAPHTIVVAHDSAAKAAHEKANKRDNKPNRDEASPSSDIDELKKQYNHCQQELAGYSSKLEEAETKLRKADSLQVSNSDKSENEKLSKNFNKAKNERDKIKAGKEKCEADCNRIAKQIEESEKT